MFDNREGFPGLLNRYESGIEPDRYVGAFHGGERHLSAAHGNITDKTLHGKWLAVIYIALGDNKTHYLRSGDNAKRNKQE